MKPDIHFLEAGFSSTPDFADETIWQKTEMYFPHCRPCVLEQVEKLHGYPPNWDGYGAKPFTTEMIEAVRKFLDHLPDALYIRPYKDTDCFIPVVVPMSSGSIQLEWHVGSRLLELEFETPAAIHYLKWWPKEGIEEEGVYTAADCRQSFRLIEWVLRGYDPE